MPLPAPTPSERRILKWRPQVWQRFSRFEITTVHHRGTEDTEFRVPGSKPECRGRLARLAACRSFELGTLNPELCTAIAQVAPMPRGFPSRQRLRVSCRTDSSSPFSCVSSVSWLLPRVTTKESKHTKRDS